MQGIRNYFTGLLLFVFTMNAVGQKKVEKVFPSSGISSMEIQGLNAYKIIVFAKKTDHVRIQAQMNGEYRNELYVVANVEEHTLNVKAEFSPSFDMPDDKLSAHKVISVRIIVEVPEYLEVLVLGADTEVDVSGKYNQVKTKTRSGTTRFYDVEGDLDAYSFQGDIRYKSSGGNIKASSKFGKVINRGVSSGNSLISLKTVHGNIYISQNE